MEMVTFEPWVKNAVDKFECNQPELRDLFAMNALQGIISCGDFHGSEDQYAEQAYAFADAMLKARKRR